MTHVDFATMTGRDVLERVRGLPPGTPSILRLMGMSYEEIEDGRAVVSLATKSDFSNPFGVMQGGVAATLLDTVMGSAVGSVLPTGVGYTTLELKVNYIRPVGLDAVRLTGEGTTIHVGRQVATAQGRVTDEHGKLIAHATTTCIILRP